ncbi:MAG: hypothetical protein O2816_06955 [Planctomycetota bacterium]|nr:hypothetical protein [Planctomycetota bacterium]
MSLKRSLLLCLPLLVSPALTSCGAQPAPATAEAAAQLVVRALREGRFDLCEPMLMREEDVDWMAERLEGVDSTSAERFLESYQELGAAGVADEVRAKNREAFDGMVQEARDGDIDLKGITFDELYQVEENEVDRLQILQFYIRLRFKGRDQGGEINMDTMIRLPRGLVMFQLKS